jgi:hypothetical protein
MKRTGLSHSFSHPGVWWIIVGVLALLVNFKGGYFFICVGLAWIAIWLFFGRRQ